MGRGQEAVHKRVEEHKRRETPQIEYDFMSMKANGIVVENGEIVDHDDRYSTHLIAIGKDSRIVLFESLGVERLKRRRWRFRIWSDNFD